MADEPMRVVVVAAQEATRRGLTALLDASQLDLADPVNRIEELRSGGTHCDVCVVAVVEPRSEPELLTLLNDFPTVVVAASTDWQPRVAWWTLGARSVVGMDIRAEALVDAVVDAVRRPHAVKPHLAAALGEAFLEGRIQMPKALRDVLKNLAASKSLPWSLTEAKLDEDQLGGLLDDLRAQCRANHLDRFDTTAEVLEPGQVPPEALGLDTRTREMLKLYALGLSHRGIGDRLYLAEKTIRNNILGAMTDVGIVSGRRREVQLLFAMWISGVHRDPDAVRRQLFGDEPE